MTAELDLLLRDAGIGDTAAPADVVATVVERSPLAGWLHPRPAGHAQSVHDQVRHLVGRASPAISVQVAEHHGQLTGAAIWTVCTSTEQPHLAVALPVSRPHHHHVLNFPRRLAHTHPVVPHDHLPLIAVATIHRRRGIGTALLTDPDRTRGPGIRAGYTVLPHLTPLAARAGYQQTGPPVQLSPTLALNTCHRPVADTGMPDNSGGQSQIQTPPAGQGNR